MPVVLFKRKIPQNWKIVSGSDYESEHWFLIYSPQFLIIKCYLHHGSGRVVKEPEGKNIYIRYEGEIYDYRLRDVFHL